MPRFITRISRSQVWTALLLVLMLSGCASLVGENAVDWFVRVANEPDMADKRFCVSSAPETSDGSNPDERGVAHMRCGDNLESVKKNTVSDCENSKKTRCMPVYYFERGKHEFVQSFESENMALKRAEAQRRLADAQRAERERVSKICTGYGFKRGTNEHANCVMRQVQHEKEVQLQRQSVQAQQRLIEAQQQQARAAAAANAMRAIQNSTSVIPVTPAPEPSPIRSLNSGTWCRPQAGGTFFCQ